MVETAESLTQQTTLPLFVAATRGCDMACWYCTEYGENRSGDGARLDDQALLGVIESAYEAGVRTYRFTGGEPTLRKSLGELMVGTQALGEDVRLALTTNGSGLENIFPSLEKLNAPSVFLSVDSYDDITDETESTGHKIEKWLSPKVEELIDTVPDNVRLRLNYVLTTGNKAQLPKLIEYAVEQGLDIKIFELLLRDYFYVEGQTSPEAFLSQYQSVRDLLPALQDAYGEPEDFAGTGGKGIPMRAFVAGDTSRVITFDSSSGSHYGEVCDDCVHFPCQEGLYALTLASNGVLHPSGCANESTYIDIVPLSSEDRVKAFHELTATVLAATFRSDVPDIFNIVTARPKATPVTITRKNT